MTKDYQIHGVLIEEGCSGAMKLTIVPPDEGVVLMENNGDVLMEDSGSVLTE